MKLENILRKYYLFKFLSSAGFISAVLVPFFTDWGGLTLFQTQLLQSWFMLWIFILEIPTGAVADYFGRRYSLIAGMSLITIITILYGSTPHFGVFLFAEFVYALATSLISGADEALLYDTLKQFGKEGESKKIFARANNAHLLGVLVSGPIGSVIASYLFINSPMILSFIPYGLAVIVGLTIPEPKVKEKISESLRYVEVMKTGVLYLIKSKGLRHIVADMVLVAIPAYFVIWYYQPLLRKIQIPLFYFGFVHATLLLSEMIVSHYFEFLEKLFGNSRRYMKMSALLVGVSFILAGVYPHFISVALFIVMAGGFGLTRRLFVSTHVNKLIPSTKRATVLSSISMLRRFALAIVTPFIAFIADVSLQSALFILGSIALFVFLFSPLKQSYFDSHSD